MVNALPEDIVIEARDTQDLGTYPFQLAFLKAGPLEMLLRIGASPAGAQAAICQLPGIMPVGSATLTADDTRRKRREPGIGTACHISLHPGPLLVFIFFGPAVLLCRRYPLPGDDPSVFQMELHHLVGRDDDSVNLVKKNLFIESIQSEHNGAFLFQDFLRDASLGTTVPALRLVGLAGPELLITSVLP